MPAIFTHYIFGKQVSDKSDKYRSIFLLGSQGPDVFFYYGYNFKKRKDKKLVRNFGTMLHHIDISEVYNFFVEYALKKEGDERDILMSYIRGIFIHYSLDRNAHPYIFYRSGFTYEPTLKSKYSYSHAFFEAYIDTLLYKKYHETRRNVNCIKADKKQVLLVSKMYDAMNKAILKQDYIDEKSYYTSWKDFKFMSHVFYSPLYIKKGIYYLFFKKTLLYAMSSPDKVRHNDKMDLLNESHSFYQDCVSGEKFNFSFFDLMDNAKKDVKRVDEFLAKALDGENIKGEIMDFVHNIDHDGFIVASEKKYYSLPWDVLKRKPIDLQ